MITVNKIRLGPTFFPDKTSQLWHLPKEIMEAETLLVDWRFEEEREIYDLLALRALKPEAFMDLYVPYLPFGRQDKPISNESTFNLRIFLQLIKSARPDIFSTLDAHNPKVVREVLPFENFENINPHAMQQRLIARIKPNTLVFPDAGARDRYKHNFKSQLVFNKCRDPGTGKILAHKINQECSSISIECGHFLIIDDICDGGATFLGIEETIREFYGKDSKISLFVTHGIFSKGRKVLTDRGIDLYTTNSLPHNNFKRKKGIIPV
jgi:ribose-phosphate pyrophosphokinase